MLSAEHTATLTRARGEYKANIPGHRLSERLNETQVSLYDSSVIATVRRSEEH